MSNFAETNARCEFALGLRAKRLAPSDDIGTAVALLASDDAHWIAGAPSRVDGGS